MKKQSNPYPDKGMRDKYSRKIRLEGLFGGGRGKGSPLYLLRYIVTNAQLAYS